VDQELANGRREGHAALDDPVLVRQAGVQDRSGPADHGLTEARDLGDTTRIADIVDRWGVDLAHGPYADLVYEAAAELPLELGENRPGLAFRFEDLGRLPIGTTPVTLPRTPDEARAEFGRNGDLRLRQALVPLATRRRLGRYDEALTIAYAGSPLAEANYYPWYGRGSQILPYWYLQAGITCLEAGELETAERFYLKAWTYRGRDPYGFVSRDIAGKLAILTAFTGDHVASLEWLDRGRTAGRRADLWVDRFVESTLGCAAAMEAVDALAPDAERLLLAACHPGQRDGHWPIFVWAHVQHALAHGDVARARRHLQDAFAVQPSWLIEVGLAASLIPLARAQTHLAAGQANQALTELDGAPDALALTRVLRARILLLAGQAEQAIEIIEAMLALETTGTRARTEALFVAACARLTSGDRSGAVAAARMAASAATERQDLRALATVPRAALDDLAADVPSLPPLLGALDERGIGEVYPPSIQLVSVTEREQDLLRELTSGQTLGQIAEAHFVSVNTIRTHLANLRRKLGARSRDEVLAKARLLGLLDKTR